MYTGKVIGTVVCSQKYETLVGKKILLIQVIENGKPTKQTIALDGIGVAGEGDFVKLEIHATVGVVQNEVYLSDADRLSCGRPGKDDIFHCAAA